WAGGGLARRLASADFLRPFAPRTPALFVLVAALASLFHFNLDTRWDDSALYFFGAYALGIASGWAIRSGKRNRYRLLILGVGLAALALEFRARILIATLTALLLAFGRLVLLRREVRIVHYLGGISYALFLVHYPLYLAIAAGFHHAGLTTPVWSLAGLALTWLASMLAADAFHRWVELPLNRWRKRLSRCAPLFRPLPAGYAGTAKHALSAAPGESLAAHRAFLRFRR
ncbi:MAG: acyltransferase family protein, partial [Rhodocyclaceae bacterium]|nr:acyltransferase family protein [Rhodocyclaceae bacterium]